MNSNTRHVARLACCMAMIALVAAADRPPATGFCPFSKSPAARRVEAANRKGRLLSASNGEPLPSRWDSRSLGIISSIKDQGNVGACWAFAAYATLETQLLRAGRGVYDFSEKNMVNLHGFEWGCNDGGNYTMSAAYLLRWGGAVAETNDVYITSPSAWTSSPHLPPILRVQHVVWIPRSDKSGDFATNLKSAIREYGAVATTLGWYDAYNISNAYYNSSVRAANHAIAAIGWDDDFPASAFRKSAPSNGAWLIKNSWGTGFGDNGYHWISYCDVSFGCDMDGMVLIPAGDGEDYDTVRGYDRLGCTYDVTDKYPKDELNRYDLQACVFTSSWNEELAAIGVYSTVYPNPYTISIYTNVTRGASSPVEGGVLAHTQSGTLTHAGFTTIHLDSSIALPDTNAFAVVYRQTGSERSTCINCTATDEAYPTHERGNCYLGYVTDAGTNNWFDAYGEADRVDVTDISWALCIKAYTRHAAGTPASDMPGELEDGTDLLADLKADNWPWNLETGETFGAAAGLPGANGRSLWSSWLTGLDWLNPTSSEFKVSIEMSGGKPTIIWTPDLGKSRNYTVYGRTDLSDESEWEKVDPSDPGADGARFFKVSVGR